MNNFTRIAASSGIAIGAVVTAYSIGAASVGYVMPHAPPAGHSVKLVSSGGGHGSATHIGNGIYITAAHVVKDATEMSVKYDNGRNATADVLWTNTKYDIALMHSDVEGVDVASLECRTPIRNESLMLSGNPQSLEFVDTWGKVMGGELTIEPEWEKVIPVDGVVVPGMSGGGAFDIDGDLVGVTVGTMAFQMNYMSVSLVPVSYIVPSSVVCFLMGRD